MRDKRANIAGVAYEECTARLAGRDCISRDMQFSRVPLVVKHVSKIGPPPPSPPPPLRRLSLCLCRYLLSRCSSFPRSSRNTLFHSRNWLQTSRPIKSVSRNRARTRIKIAGILRNAVIGERSSRAKLPPPLSADNLPRFTRRAYLRFSMIRRVA